jgi:hypothetical protein
VDGARHLDAVGRGGERHARRLRRRGGSRIDHHGGQLAQALGGGRRQVLEGI